MLDELETKVGRHYLVVNRATGPLTPELEQTIADNSLDLAAVVPEDPQVAVFDAAGRPMWDLPEGGPVGLAVDGLVDTILGVLGQKEACGADHR